jgi:hypothetical protein
MRRASLACGASKKNVTLRLLAFSVDFPFDMFNLLSDV